MLKFPTNVDSTMLSTFGSCPQKFFIEFILGRAPVGRSVHLHAGGCIASATEDIRIAYYRDGMHLDDCFELAFRNYVRNWGDYEPPEKEYKDFVNCWSVVEAYFHEYPPATDHFQPFMMPDGSPAVEFTFGIPMDILHPETGNPILYSGRLDMLAQPKGQDNVYAVDEKTTKSMGSIWQYQWDMRGQFFGYARAAREHGYNVTGALVRGLCIQETQFQFQEKPIFFSNKQLDHWWAQAHRKVGRMTAMYVSALRHEDNLREMHDAFDYSYGDACAGYGGCQMKDLCVHPEPWHIYEGWEKRMWNPMAKDPTAESEDRLSQMGQTSFMDAMEGM